MVRSVHNHAGEWNSDGNRQLHGRLLCRSSIRRCLEPLPAVPQHLQQESAARTSPDLTALLELGGDMRDVHTVHLTLLLLVGLDSDRPLGLEGINHVRGISVGLYLHTATNEPRDAFAAEQREASHSRVHFPCLCS